MTSFRYVISVKDGLHARNAMELSRAARAAGAYKCSITLQTENGQKANCKNVMSLMGLKAAQGMTVVLEANGEDEEAAVGYLKGFIRMVL